MQGSFCTKLLSLHIVCAYARNVVDTIQCERYVMFIWRGGPLHTMRTRPLVTSRLDGKYYSCFAAYFMKEQQNAWQLKKKGRCIQTRKGDRVSSSPAVSFKRILFAATPVNSLGTTITCGKRLLCEYSCIVSGCKDVLRSSRSK